MKQALKLEKGRDKGGISDNILWGMGRMRTVAGPYRPYRSKKYVYEYVGTYLVPLPVQYLQVVILYRIGTIFFDQSGKHE